MSNAGTSESLPETMEAAVQRLRAILSEQDQKKIRMMRREELFQLHFGLGMWIRNKFGLWREGSPLMASLGQCDADEASGILLEALWRDLRQTGPST